MQYQDRIAIRPFAGAKAPVDCVMSGVIGLLGECPLLREDKDGNDCQQQTGRVEQPNEKIFMQARVHFVRVLGQRTRF
jgi:hypothetical protein